MIINIRFVTIYHECQALFRKKIIKKFKGLKLLRPSKTRIGTNFVMFERILNVKTPL